MDSDPTSDEETQREKIRTDAYHRSLERRSRGGLKEQENDWIKPERRRKVLEIMALKPIEELPENEYSSCQIIQRIEEGKVTGVFHW